MRELFPEVPAASRADALRRLARATHPAGTALVREGEAHDTLFLIRSGRVAVDVGGFRAGTLGPGEMFGEIGLFTRTVRTATVTALEPVDLAIVGPGAYRTLRLAGNPVARAIEARAAHQLTTRLRAVLAEVRLLAGRTGQLVGEPPLPGQHAGNGPAPSRVADPQLPDVLARLGRPVRVASGATLARYGTRDGPLWWLVEGDVQLWLPVEGGEVMAAQVDAGQPFAVPPLVDGLPRPVRYVAGADSVVVSIEPRPLRAILHEDGADGSALRVALIEALAARVNAANATYSMARLGAAEVDGVAAPVAPEPVSPRDAQEAEPLAIAPLFLGEDPSETWDTWFELTSG